MPTYHEILTTDLSTLTTAATRWDGMATELGKQETAYRNDVHGITLRPTWAGESRQAANARFGVRLADYQNAQTEAKAIASLLRDAHTQFVDLRKKLESARDDAIAKGMKVSDQGVVSFDTEKLSQGARTAYVHDPSYQDSVRKDVASWQAHIDRCVQDVDDADKGVEVAFTAVVKGPDTGDSTVPGFNGKAQGDIEKYEAQEADDIARRVAKGEKVSAADLAELKRAFRDNKGDKSFDQTFLNGLGTDGTLRFTNKLEDLAYFDDTKNKSTYLEINGGLADSLAVATGVPDFKDSDGRHLRFGSDAYDQAFQAWAETDDARFYNKWRAELRQHGGGEYDLEAAGNKVSVGYGHGQKIRGYQSLATLMQQGRGYSPQFVADVTDDMIAMEKKDPDIWDLYGKFDGKNGDGWFANDPVDGALGVMSRDPEGAAGYLDPGTSAGKERSDYLLGHGHGSRDWNVVNTTHEGAKTDYVGPDVQDADDRKGLGDALTAAATGVDPNGPRPMSPTAHTDANNRVFTRALGILSGQGDDMPASLRDDMAKIMVNHGHETYVAMSDASGNRHPDSGPTLNQKQVMEMTKQISRSQNSYGLLHQGMNYAIMDDIHDSSRRPEDTLSSAGYAVGFMEDARYSALKDAQHDYTWDKAWSYHVSGAMLNFIPVYGDIAQRGADVVTSAWVMDEQQHQSEQLTSSNQDTYDLRKNQLNSIADQWYSANSDWANDTRHPGYSRDDGVYKQIEGWANDGGSRFRGMAGIH
ncbi:hypothetical protein GTY81_02880 [Streptomyces sp. SID8366]|uniref:hypothetical protein n=1 Tax=unclassified Streptomyces TaxID=2593676 RepID=UPI000DBA8D28|nr:MULTISPECIES: hypothetical protein [unclassified Streptomyces]MYU02855.1 hypothetical protein [Streptomyces sp. SID8366]MYU61960.1 hypothetical protein [Streptomyces sp. SID69]RAJ52608.1 hypothetical protein K376_05773 [Streptomyces sp. PsTaAH-130]